MRLGASEKKIRIGWRQVEGPSAVRHDVRVTKLALSAKHRTRLPLEDIDWEPYRPYFGSNLISSMQVNFIGCQGAYPEENGVGVKRRDGGSPDTRPEGSRTCVPEARTRSRPENMRQDLKICVSLLVFSTFSATHLYGSSGASYSTACMRQARAASCPFINSYLRPFLHVPAISRISEYTLRPTEFSFFVLGTTFVDFILRTLLYGCNRTRNLGGTWSRDCLIPISAQAGQVHRSCSSNQVAVHNQSNSISVYSI